jgi:hypothetical protein
MIYDVFAGPQVDEETLRYAWEGDGIVNLPAPYLDQLGALGFDGLDYADATAEGERVFRVIHRAVEAQRECILAASDDATFAEWRDSAVRYADCFATGKLAYGCLRATRRL